MPNRPSSFTVTALLGLAILFISGCNTVYPVASGSHAPIDPSQKNVKRRVVVWSNHPGIGNAIVGWLQQGGQIVVERARLQTVFNEQSIRLTHTPDDDANVLRVGKLIGAERIIFAEATVTSAISSRAYVGAYGGGARSDTVYHLSVSVRNVDVESGEIRWSGTATYPKPVNNPDQGLIYLAQSAIARAICPLEDGFAWTDSGGCVKK
jgi:hypothetical protein